MSIPTSYFTSTKNLAEILRRMQRGEVPSKFTYDFLKKLGFPSSSDRPLIPVLKALGFLDSTGVPQQRYRLFKDQSQAPVVMAQAIREAYTDVFAIDENAHKLPPEDVNGIFARLSDKGESVTDKMAMTFRALVEQANFDAVPDESADEEEGAGLGVDGSGADDERGDLGAAGSDGGGVRGGVLSLRHDVHVHLPATDDIKVYDAIFRSLREHLLG